MIYHWWPSDIIEDKTAELFKNLRLEIFASPCVISLVVLGDIPNEDMRAGLSRNLRLEILASSCLISKVVLRDIRMKTRGLGSLRT